MDWVLILTLAKLAIPAGLLGLLAVLVVMERRGAAYIQDRPGPNRAGLFLQLRSLRGLFTGQAGGLRLRGFGLMFNLADAVKTLTKEPWLPPFAQRGFYLAAPFIPLLTGLLTPALIPWFAPLTWAGEQGVLRVSGQAIDSASGILALFALASLSVYGVVLGSWASRSKYSLLGGLRASAMMISYEVSMGLAVMGMLLVVGDLSLSRIVEWQGQHVWGVVVQPLGFLLFLVAMFAECNRTPFDVVEGDSEIVAGFHTEYHGPRFTLFMMAEYTHLLVASALIATVYLGGWNPVPFPLPALSSLGGVLPADAAPEAAAASQLIWVCIDGEWMKANLGLALTLLLVPAGLGVWLFSWLIARRRSAYVETGAKDTDLRYGEYRFYIVLCNLAGAALIAGGLAAWGLIETRPDARGLFPLWVNLTAAAIQMAVVIGKTLALCWLFVWVRWTLPRFRYDQIMDLGWKVLLNLALLNLVVTAVVKKAVQ